MCGICSEPTVGGVSTGFLDFKIAARPLWEPFGETNIRILNVQWLVAGSPWREKKVASRAVQRRVLKLFE